MKGAHVIGWAIVSLVLPQLDMKPIEVRHTYRGPEGTIELEGVCQVTAEAVTCWKADRSPHLLLEKRVESYLLLRSRIGIAYGKKARYAVFRMTHPTSSGLPQGRIELEGISWQLTDTTSFLTHGRDELVGVYIVADSTATKGEFTANISRAYGQTAPLKLDSGSTVKLRHGTLRFVRSEVAKLDTAIYGLEAGPRWLIHCDYEGTAMVSGGITASDRDDIEIRALDMKGKPVLIDPRLLHEVGGFQHSGPIGAKPQFMGARVQGFGSFGSSILRPGANIIATNIDPSLIGSLRFSYSETQPLKITDIPLDPK